MITHWKFPQWEIDTTPMEFKDEQSIRNFLQKEYTSSCQFGYDNLVRTGIYKEGGWAYDFRPYLRKILVKQYDHWQELYAPNKTTLRHTLYGRVQQMIYIEK